MSKIFKIQSSFTAGEISPRMYSRIDLAKFSTGLETCVNFLILPYGGAYRRPGTKYLAAAKSNSASSRLKAFEYSNEQSYVLEFCDEHIRFFTEQSKVLQSRGITNGSFTSDISGWANASSGTGSISHDAGNLRLALTGGGASNEARAVWSTNLDYYGTSAYTITLDVFTSSVVVKVGTTSGGSEITSATVTTGTAKTVAFTPSQNYAQLYITLEASATAGVDNISISSPVYEIDSPYDTTELSELRFAQKFDTLYIVHGSHAPMQLVRYSSDKWVLSEIDFDEPAYLDENTSAITMDPAGVTGSVTITASSASFASTDVGRAIRFKSGEDSTDAQVYTGTGTQTNFDIPFYPQGASDIEVYLVAATGVRTLQTVPTNYSITDGQVDMVTAPSSSEKLIVQRANTGSGEWGWGIITAYSSTTQVTVSIQKDLGGANASLMWRLGAWSDTTGWPKSVALHEGRLWMGNTATQPQTFWASKIGVLTNFQPDNALYKGDVDDETGFTFTLGGNKSQAITWLAGKTNMVIGTTNGIYSVRPSSTGAISALNITARKEVDIPCEFKEPAETFNQIIFIERLKKRIYSLTYSFNIDGYQPSELTLLSDHLGQVYTFEELAFQDVPSRVLWVRRSNGTLVACTYLPDQEVIGWTRHTIGGTSPVVNSLCTIAGEAFSELWMNISRTINGSTKQYVEFLTEEFYNDDKADATFSDSSLKYTGASTSVITGLDHLEGQSVSVLNNGSVESNKTVSAGSITLTNASTKAIIGLSYTSELRSLSIETGTMSGTSQGQISRIFQSVVRFYETLGGKVGYDSSNMETLPYRSPGDLMDTSSTLYSGYKILEFPYGYDNELKLYVQQPQPLPMTVLGVIYKAVISDY